MSNCICITNTCNDIQTRNKFVEDNLRFVFWCADEFSTYNVPHKELISAGNEALIESANRFDPTYGTHFISYAVRNIRQSMFDTVNEYYQTVHIPSNRLKDVKIHYESFEVFDSPYADGDDDDYLAPRPFSASRWSLANRFVSSKRTR